MIHIFLDAALRTVDFTRRCNYIVTANNGESDDEHAQRNCPPNYTVTVQYASRCHVRKCARAESTAKRGFQIDFFLKNIRFRLKFG